MIPLDALSSVVDAISNFIEAVVNAILIVGVGVIYGILIALIIGFLVLGLVKFRDQFRKKD